MKRFETFLWTVGGAGLAVGTAYSIINSEQPRTIDKTKPAVIVDINGPTQGPGSYVDGAFSEDQVHPANIVARQCPDQNPELTKCIDGVFAVPTDLLFTFTLNQVIIIENIAD